MSDLTLRAERLTLGYRDRRVLQDLTLTLPPGQVTTILGPNGCGKSTLLRALARLLAPLAGRVTLGGEDVRTQNTRALARRLAILPQAPLAPDGITVGELVRRGRAPWRGVLAAWNAADERACARALDAVAMTALADRPLGELSGGQRQRAWIALVLAQDTPVLLLDEPTTWLDLPHQIEVLRLLRRRNREAGTTIVCVLHDLNLAARFSDHLVLLGPDGVVAEGPPDAVVTEAHLASAFSLAARVLRDPVSDTPMVVPL
ncbi:ABC transporter ATP-binding protein [Aureimonas pseudogalii]|uniref:Iron complex transport system ATP-binding protein n=1 Tax=Aureimonas pseudogalii TaxID=1744844 RepID=A0A7W6H3G3_9HYPH|nr:ABC transporter ATP-binding protein [Aureimonas pseudogalii]MBB3997142.1 iron complex transport system ATP-binding protein [Aureimonas pseudogalii]